MDLCFRRARGPTAFVGTKTGGLRICHVFWLVVQGTACAVFASKGMHVLCRPSKISHECW